ncbi:methyl-accepting chemotaxis protein [Lonsdalea quercina]|uniref:methyl-accepting chemotaxis protein n=1 Tax=Lonsdalea quercina TaxID=71657 RepID=UPI003974AE4C
MLKNITVKSSLIVLLSVMVLLLLLVSGIGANAISQGNASLSSIDKIQGKELGTLAASYTATLRARTTAYQAARQMDEGNITRAKETLSRVESYLERSRKDMDEFLAYGTVTAKGAILAEQIKTSYESYRNLGITPMMDALKKGDTVEFYKITQDVVVPYSMAMDKAINDFRVFAVMVGDNLLTKAEELALSRLSIIGLSCVLTLLLSGVAWVVIKRLILQPLDRSVYQLEVIAGGDLSQHIEDGGKNEIGRLIQAMKTMQDALANAVGRVRDAGSHIEVGTRELSAGNINLAERTEESAASLEQTAASMEQLSSTVRLNAESADQAYLLSQNVADIADKGSDAVRRMLEKMELISQSTASVADILAMIDGIAFQTNILALNAAVEAARAGEQGRGFAVVAGEVRSLAQRSAQSAKEIKTLLEDSQVQVREGTEIAQVAGETMKDVSSAVVQVTTLMGEISTATREQSNGIDQVNTAVSQMDSVAQQNASLVEESASATRSLEEQSMELAASMALFKLGNEPLAAITRS